MFGKKKAITITPEDLVGITEADPDRADPEGAETEGTRPETTEPEDTKPEGAGFEDAEPEGEEPEGEGPEKVRREKKPMKKSRILTFILAVLFLIGLVVILFPTVSDWRNSFFASQTIADYVENVSGISQKEYTDQLSSAKRYNEALAKKENQYSLTEEELERYEKVLDLGDGIMGYIEIDKINVLLPICHGAGNPDLRNAVGHLEWTSLPVGGENTHCVLTGQRGLPTAKLFKNLDKLVGGDTFVIRVLDEIHTYEVDKISIVLPKDTSDITITEGEDYVTLITSTPYGINTHRLLVRGRRVDNKASANGIRIINDATRIRPMTVAGFIIIPALLLIFILVIIRDRRRETNRVLVTALGSDKDENGPVSGI